MWGGSLHHSRFMPGFSTPLVDRMTEDLETFNNLVLRLWRGSEEEALAALDEIVRDRSVLPGSGVGGRRPAVGRSGLRRDRTGRPPALRPSPRNYHLRSTRTAPIDSPQCFTAGRLGAAGRIHGHALDGWRDAAAVTGRIPALYMLDERIERGRVIGQLG